ncbi:Fic/DOC family N-terminal domain-containing protein [Vibrio sp. TH_r3]|uniref:Fic/DOC family N-terminal domain-containing protein n=1 Tax=Vibrio sp. TH_r3 TaxID=3082084 RepID=UPI0039862E45
MPNQGLLINLLPLLKAQGSSEIENIVTTTDKLFQHTHEDSQADPITNERGDYVGDTTGVRDNAFVKSSFCK